VEVQVTTPSDKATSEQGPRGPDLLDVEARLSGEEREVQRTVRSWARKRLLPGIEEWFESGEFPIEIAGEIGALGLLGMYGEPDGTPGMGAVSYGLVMVELEAVDSGFRSFVSVQSSLCMYPIQRYGSDAQRAEWLPKMSAGEAIGCFGLTEPDAGSDPASMRTFARKDGSDWLLSGSKMWITNGGIADLAVVWAQTDDGIRGFLVPRGTAGFSTRDVHRKLSLRASVTSELVFDDCRLPKEAILPGAKGLSGPLTCLNEARYGIAWGVMGAARTCLEVAIDYARSRRQFGRPIGSFQLTQAKLADMTVEYTKGLLLAERLGELKQARALKPEQVSVAKLNNTRVALAIAREARTILGANGITLEYPVIRHSANLESVLTYEGTAEVHQLTIGRAITGLNAFS
jgi:glutaryl-CoA dehydrogenase